VINGEPFTQRSATGLTMCSLFRGWPKERLACLHISQLEPDWSFCSRYWKLSFTDLRCIRFLWGKPSPKLMEVMASPKMGGASQRVDENNGSAIHRYVKRLRRRLAGQAVTCLDVYRIPARILKEIDDFRPQVVYSMLGSNTLLRLATDMADLYSIPIVPHFMDDWPTTHYCFSVFRLPLRRAMRRGLIAVIERSPKRMVICNAMAEEYARRYGGEFMPFMNAVEPEILEQPVVLPRERRKVRLIYAGGLHLNRWRSLQDIGMALKELQQEGLEVEALVYSQPRFAEEARKLDIPPVMRPAGSLTPSEICDVLRDADILLHVESFDRHSQTYTRYSISAKIPECMAASRPLLAYGPDEVAAVRYVRDTGAGLVVGRRDHADLVSSLRELVTSEQLRERLGKQGHLVAAQRHNAALQREQFRSILEAVVAGAKNR